MAYIASNEDFDEPKKNSKGYIATPEDFEEKPKSFGEELSSIGKSVLQGTKRAAEIPLNIGSALGQHVFNIGEDVANIPNTLSGGYIPKFSGHMNVPLGNPEAPESQITENLVKGGEAAGDVAGLYGLGKAGLSALRNTKTGAKVAENLFKNKAIQQADINHRNYLAESANKLNQQEADLNQHKSVIDDLLSKQQAHESSSKDLLDAASNQSTNLIKKLLHGQKVGREYEPIVNEVKDIFKDQLSTYQDEMNPLTEKISKDWFLSGEKPGGLGSYGKTPENLKRLKESNEIVNKITGNTANLEKKSKILKNKINNFRENPTFDNAHTLQSMLGEMGSNLSSSAVGSERSIGGQYLKARNNIKDLMYQTISKTNPELAKKYTEMSDRFLEHIVPFKTNTALNKLLTKKGAQELGGENIGKIFSGNDAATTNVFNRLSDKSKDLLLAQRLSKVVRNIPGKDISVDENKLLNETSKLGRERLDKLVSGDTQNQISQIHDAREQALQHKKLADIHNDAYKDASKEFKAKQKLFDTSKEEREKISDFLLKTKQNISNQKKENIDKIKHLLIAGTIGAAGAKGYNTISRLLSGD